MPKKLILRCGYALGDIVLLSAAVRDLHLCYPQRFLTDVATTFREVWDHNPFLTPIQPNDRSAQLIDCKYPLINESNRSPFHCLHGFSRFLNSQLNLNIRPTAFRGDIHLSQTEKGWMSQVEEITGRRIPFWIISAGGKYDVTVKWWDYRRYQQVVNHFRGRIQFVQVGKQGHEHPKMEGAIDLRGKTSVRELIRLVYHAQGVLCPITSLMHLAAAVEVRRAQPPFRPCVVVAGAREPAHWEAYPMHRYMSNTGSLDCCAEGGCWKDRTYTLGDGSERDEPSNLCSRVVGVLPKCMDMIQAADVIRQIESYFENSQLKYLDGTQRKAALRGVRQTRRNSFDQAKLALPAFRPALERCIQGLSAYPGGFRGRGLVMCGGGVRYFTNAWVCIRLLRKLGCHLPIELWHLGPSEFDQQMETLITPLGVKCIDASRDANCRLPQRSPGWALKPYAIQQSRFREVLFLDADNVPVRAPDDLFDAPAYRGCGAVFWPDDRLAAKPPVWAIFGLPTGKGSAFETGQILIDKRACWKPLSLTVWLNQQGDFLYEHIYGDKETFRLAFAKLGCTYAMPKAFLKRIPYTILQHDFRGRRLFQHRNTDKWNLLGNNIRVPGFRHSAVCEGFIRELQGIWDGRMSRYDQKVKEPGTTARTGPRGRVRRSPDLGCLIYTCPERAATLKKTYQALHQTDWSDGEIQVVMDRKRYKGHIRRIVDTYHRALRLAARGKREYVLILEDDLMFNRHLHYNLTRWVPLLKRQIWLAYLFNPGVKQLACDPRHHCFLAKLTSVYSTQAILWSRPAMKDVLDNWDWFDLAVDLRIAQLVRRAGRQIHFHAPSLVEHRDVKSVWGGRYRGARDFSPDWRNGQAPQEPTHGRRAGGGAA